jgi:nucleotidyltransferase substrate binding protein (TIGR01987 family)
MDTLDLTPFSKAITRLEAGLTALSGDPTNTLMRDGVIQRFEFTYELCHKMLKRYIEATSANPQEVDTLDFQGLIRVGSEQGLLRSGWKEWRNLRQARGITSHTYDEAKALQVLAVVPEFLAEAQYLYARLSERHVQI